MPSLLVIDDEPNVLYSMEKGFQSDALTVLTALAGLRLKIPGLRAALLTHALGPIDSRLAESQEGKGARAYAWSSTR